MALVGVGDRVRVKELGIKGVVEYIDYPNLFNDYQYPVQIKLDKPWDRNETGLNAWMYRTGLSDLVKLKPKNKKKATKEEIRQFLDWLKSAY